MAPTHRTTDPDDARPVERRTLTVGEAAQALGIGRSAGYAAARSGELPTVRIGRRLLVPRDALDRMLAGEGHAA